MVLIMLLINILIIFFEWIKGSISAVFWAVIFLIFSCPHLLHSMDSTYDKEILSTVSMFAIIFMSIYFIVRLLILQNKTCISGVINVEKIKNEGGKLIPFIYFVYIISFLIIAINFYVDGGSLLTVKAYTASNIGLIEKIARLVLISVSGIGFIALIRKEYLLFVIFTFIYLFYFIVTQIRYNLLGFFAPFFLLFLFNNNKRKRVYGVLIGLVFVVFVFFTQQLRWMGGLSNAINAGMGVLIKNTIDYIKAGNGEFGLIKAFYYFVENNNNFQKFGEGLGFIRLLLIFLPASLFTFKPRDFAIDMYREWFKVDNPNGTMHPTAFGDAYANFGLPGFLIGIFYALFFYIIDKYIESTKFESVKILKISLAFTMMVLVARGAVYNGIFNCVLGWLILYFFEKIFQGQNNLIEKVD